MKIRVLCFDDIIRISSFLPLDSFIEVSDYVRASNGTFYYNNDNKALFFSFSSGLDQDKLLTISNEVEEEAESWVKEAPIIPNSVVNNDLWNYVWVLHRFFCLQVFRTEPDCSHIEDPKSKICNLSFRDLVCVLDDLMWYKPDFVCSFLKVIKEFYSRTMDYVNQMIHAKYGENRPYYIAAASSKLLYLRNTKIHKEL